jgi:hypothetical protein
MVEFWGESITVLSKVVADIKTPPGGVAARPGKSKADGKKGGKPGLVVPDPATSVYRNLYRNFKLRSLYIFILYSILPLWIAGLVVHVISTMQAARLVRLGRAVVVGRRLLRFLWVWAAVSLALGLFLLTRNFPEFVVSRYIMEFMTGLF